MVKIHQNSWKTFPSGTKINLVKVKLKDKFNFECQRCGDCCYSPPSLNPAEAYRIANRLGVSIPEFLGDYVTFENSPRYGWKAVVNKNEDGHCTFYEGNKCGIFTAAPRQCAAKPLRLGSSEDRDTVSIRSLDLMLSICPGIGKGKEHTVKEWVREKRLDKLWQEEVEHLHEVEMWMYYPDSLSRVMDMFLKYKG